MIRKMGEKKAITKQKFKEAQEDMKIHHMIEERQKSSNQRELEKRLKDQEEMRIKKTLDSMRRKEQRDTWSGKDSIMNQKTNILTRSILKERNIFLDGKSTNPINQEKLFFRW